MKVGQIGAFHLVRTHLGGEGGSSLLYISIAYYRQNGEGVQISCTIAYVLIAVQPCTKDQAYKLYMPEKIAVLLIFYNCNI